MDGLHIDYSIRMGDFLTAGSFIFMAGVAISTLRGTLKLFGYRLDILDASVEDLKRDYSNNKVQDTKIERLEQDTTLMRQEIHELRHGDGYIHPRK